MDKKFDFAGWATKANLKCADGLIIEKDAFIENDGKTVPLVWNHLHNDPNLVLGHALLENKEEGVYAYCSFNDTETGKTAKLLVDNGDIESLSIYANKLQKNKNHVVHGLIREVSLVLAGANPGAFIDSRIAHGEQSEEDAIIFTGETIVEIENEIIEHSDKEDKLVKENDLIHSDDNKSEEKSNTKTVGDVIDTLNDEQLNAVTILLETAIDNLMSDEDDEENGGDDNMKHNVFENDNNNNEEVLAHDALQTIIADGKRYGSLKESFLQHASDYGMTNIGYLVPDEKSVTPVPGFIKRDDTWVTKVMGKVHRTPFSRIKSIFADITEDDARAKGYTKGKLKKDEVFALLKRTTTPTTVYKKQRMDRDDVVDITDFDVIAWLKSEMRMMLDEEIARAILVGDGRIAASDDKISESCIRPIWTDEDLYTIKASVTTTSETTESEKVKEFIKTALKSRKEYKGSGNPALYTTEDVLTECLLLEDTLGRRIYSSVNDLAIALRVSEIVTVESMENLSREKDGSTYNLMGIIVNLADYNIGADRGGAINMFDDFDIDYNQQKYLIETRCSGALVKPYAAIAIESVESAG